MFVEMLFVDGPKGNKFRQLLRGETISIAPFTLETACQDVVTPLGNVPPDSETLVPISSLPRRFFGGGP